METARMLFSELLYCNLAPVTTAGRATIWLWPRPAFQSDPICYSQGFLGSRMLPLRYRGIHLVASIGHSKDIILPKVSHKLISELRRAYPPSTPKWYFDPTRPQVLLTFGIRHFKLKKGTPGILKTMAEGTKCTISLFSFPGPMKSLTFGLLFKLGDDYWHVRSRCRAHWRRI